eukprot:SAG11_NODE_664_length_7866_cov_6.323291_3_plen_91_part_00
MWSSRSITHDSTSSRSITYLLARKRHTMLKPPNNCDRDGDQSTGWFNNAAEHPVVLNFDSTENFSDTVFDRVSCVPLYRGASIRVAGSRR